MNTEEEALLCGPDSVAGLPKESIAWTQEEEGVGRLVVTVNYKGVSTTTPGIAPRDKNNPIWSGKIVIREEPITSAPNLDALLKKYQGKLTADAQGRVTIKWDEFLTGGSSSGGLSGGEVSKVRNPMYGAKTFPVQEGEVQATFVHQGINLPDDIYDRLGRVLTSLKGSRIKTPKGYVWVTMAPEFKELGQKAWEIRQSYRLTLKDSYTAIIHSIIRR